MREVLTVKNGLTKVADSNYNQRLANIAKMEKRIAEANSDDSVMFGISLGGLILGVPALVLTSISERDYRRYWRHRHVSGFKVLNSRYKTYRRQKKYGIMDD